MSDTATAKRPRRQMVEEARKAAIESRWEEAIEINQELLKRTPRDAQAQNRVGKAFFELNQLQAATEAYSASLKIDPANMIARRNLQRLEQLRRTNSVRPDRERNLVPKTSVLIQEVGKTWVDELVNPAQAEHLAEISSGEALKFQVSNGHLVVYRSDDVRLGEIEARTAERVIELMGAGNRYEVYALGLVGSTLRVILREVFRDPSLGDKISFPRQISQTGQYLRERDLLRQRDESDFLFIDEEEDDSEDDEPSNLVGTDNEESLVTARDPYLEDPVGIEDEENPAS